jgi:transposase
MFGGDVHEKSIATRSAAGREKSEKRMFPNTAVGRMKLAEHINKKADGAEAVFAYEASSVGFVLCDELTEHGIECHVLAPSGMAKSPKTAKDKTDDKDAERILELVRGHVMAGNKLPDVWVPDNDTREDRELVRQRISVADKATAVKNSIRARLVRHGIERPVDTGKDWTKRYRAWLDELSDLEGSGPLDRRSREAHGSDLRILDCLEKEKASLDKLIEALASEEKYAEPLLEMRKLKGVSTVTGMTFMTEIGDMSRFDNRRKLASYLGLTPSSFESGESDDRKGRITRQGSSRVRKMLCQSAWIHIRYNPNEKSVYERILRRNPKRKKKAIVAVMRRLGIRLWHITADARAGIALPGRRIEAAREVVKGKN